MRALMLPIGDERYAVELASVREVVESPSIVRVPTARDHVVGVFNMRGEIVAAIDLARVLDLPSAPDGPSRWWAVLAREDGACALAATGTPRKVTLDQPGGPGNGPAVRARYLVEGEPVGLLDLDALLQIGAAPARGFGVQGEPVPAR